jgi:hypothetical protein
VRPAAWYIVAYLEAILSSPIPMVRLVDPDGGLVDLVDLVDLLAIGLICMGCTICDRKSFLSLQKSCTTIN